MIVGDCGGGVAWVDVPASAGDCKDIAFGTAPAGLSAISLTSLVVSASVSDAPRDWIKIVAGPWKCRNSLPYISKNSIVGPNKDNSLCRPKYSSLPKF